MDSRPTPNPRVLVVIPARGGSKGIPRKNLRSLNGKPLIHYAICTALGSRFKPDVYVSSDDDEVLMMGERYGARTLRRSQTLADDRATLDEVMCDAYRELCATNGVRYDHVVTLQPTSPLLKVSSLDSALERMVADHTIDTLISARREAHLTWRLEEGTFRPNYTARVNRQFLEPYYVETGAFLICKGCNLERHNSRIAGNIALHLLSGGEALDLDTFEDWNVCEYLMKRKRIAFVVSGYSEIGLGHVYRCLLLANSILNHDVLFLVDKRSHAAFQKIRENNYEVHIQTHDTLLEDIEGLGVDIVINDILDTDKDYMLGLKRFCSGIINFEDLGEGAECADVVINALYPEKYKHENHYYGHEYYCATDEFITAGVKKVTPRVENILITFGGTDPNNFTLKTLQSVLPYCLENNVSINVVLGLGYNKEHTLGCTDNIVIHKNIKDMSRCMLRADVVFTSAGRTVYEAACVGVPTIVLAQNEREMTHFFAVPENGFINLGLGAHLDSRDVLAAFRELACNHDLRRRQSELMLSKNLKQGKERVLELIQRIAG